MTKSLVQTQQYGLYQTLKEGVLQFSPLGKSKTRRLLVFLNDENLSLEIKEAIVMLIASFYLDEKGLKKFEPKEMPYKAKETFIGLEFDLASLPTKLVSILYRFYKINFSPKD